MVDPYRAYIPEKYFNVKEMLTIIVLLYQSLPTSTYIIYFYFAEKKVLVRPYYIMLKGLWTTMSNKRFIAELKQSFQEQTHGFFIIKTKGKMIIKRVTSKNFDSEKALDVIWPKVCRGILHKKKAEKTFGEKDW